MQMHILEDAGQELAAIDNAIRRRDADTRRAQAVRPIERLYMFAGWSLDEAARDLIGPAGQRVDLTSSEYDLLMAFLRQPGQPLSRRTSLRVARTRMDVLRSFHRYDGRATAQEAGRRVRSPSTDPVGAGRWLRLLRRRLQAWRSRPIPPYSAGHARGWSRAPSFALRRREAAPRPDARLLKVASHSGVDAKPDRVVQPTTVMGPVALRSAASRPPLESV